MQREPKPQGAEKFLGKEVISEDGQKLGVADRFINNRLTEIPQWIVVEAGLFGMKKLVVPVAGSSLDEMGVHIPFSKDSVVQEPEVDVDGLNPESEDALNSYFGLGASA